MKKRVTPQRFSRAFKIAAVRRVLAGEQVGAVARDLGIRFEMLWRWKNRVIEKGEEQLHDIGRPRGRGEPKGEEGQQKRIEELERLVGRQQMEIRFLDKALRLVEERRQQKNDDGEAAYSKR
jgi:transposase